LSDGSVATTDFETKRPLGRHETSKFYLVNITEFYKRLASSRTQNDNYRIGLYQELLNQVSSEQEARSLIREVGYFVLNKRSSNSVLNDFLADFDQMQNLDEFLSGIKTSVKKAFFSDLNLYIQSVQEMLRFYDDKTVVLTPMGNRYFWLVDNEFIDNKDRVNFNAGAKIESGLKIAFSRKTSDEVVTPDYHVVFGSSDNQSLNFFKNGQFVSSVDHQLKQNTLINLQVSFVKGVITITIDETEIASWQDDNYIEEGEFFVGLSPIGGQTDLAEVEVTGTVFVDARMYHSFLKESYSDWVERLEQKASTLTSGDFDLLSELEVASLVKFRLEGTEDDAKSLEKAINFAKKNWHFRNSPPAKASTQQSLENLKIQPTWRIMTDFLWNTYDQIKE